MLCFPKAAVGLGLEAIMSPASHLGLNESLLLRVDGRLALVNPVSPLEKCCKYHISHGGHEAKTRDMICDMLRKSVQSRLRLWLESILEHWGGARPSETKKMETRRKANMV